LLALAAHAPAASTPVTLRGTVGPGFTINLTLAGRKVTQLKRGVRYRLVVADRSSSHNFHLSSNLPTPSSRACSRPRPSSRR
jgi:hypothetical protein